MKNRNLQARRSPARSPRARGRSRCGNRYLAALSTLEMLEPRTLLSVTVLSGGKSASYIDVDGDQVTLTFSKGTLTSANFITTPSGLGDQLQEVDLSAGGFDGANISMKVVASGTGDGEANIGFLNSSGHDLGAINIIGDLGRIDAGDSKLATPAIKSLTAGSMGNLGLTTQGTDSSFRSVINGSLGKLIVNGNMTGAALVTTGGASDKIGSIEIRGSLIGNATDNTGEIFCAGAIGNITIGGNVQGGGGANSAEIAAAGGDIGTVKIGGGLTGGSGSNSADLYSSGNMGAVFIGGNMSGSDGTESAEIGTSTGKITSVSIGGSLLGGAGDQSGRIALAGDLGAVKIGGVITGNSGDNSGGISTQAGNIASVTCFGVTGGDGDISGQISAAGNIGKIKIGGSVTGGGGTQSAQLLATGSITSVTIGGSLIGDAGDGSAEILADALGKIAIAGNIQGGGGAASASITSNAGKIASLTVGGSILGGDGIGSSQVRAQTDLGQITVGSASGGGDLTADGAQSADLIAATGRIAGITLFGDLTGAGDESAEVYSKRDIGKISIKGSLIGGSGSSSAFIYSTLKIAGISIGGSILGGSGDSSGTLESFADISSVAVSGSVVGGEGSSSGVILVQGALPRVTIGGDVLGGSGNLSGTIAALQGALGTLSVAGSFICGPTGSGGAQGDAIGKVSIGGDLKGCFIASTTGGIASVTINGSVLPNVDADRSSIIKSSTTIGSVIIKQNFAGIPNDTYNTFSGITAAGGAIKGKSDRAIGSVTIGGDVDVASILAGYSLDDTSPVDPHAQIGAVSVGGNFTQGNIVAGAMNAPAGNVYFGDANDLRITSTDNSPTPISSIASIKIGGTITGSPSIHNSNDHYGFVAQQIGALTLGSTKITLASGPSNNNVVLGTTGDFNLHEIS